MSEGRGGREIGLPSAGSGILYPSLVTGFSPLLDRLWCQLIVCPQPTFVEAITAESVKDRRRRSGGSLPPWQVALLMALVPLIYTDSSLSRHDQSVNT
jgi:hypothetical protein